MRYALCVYFIINNLYRPRSPRSPPRDLIRRDRVFSRKRNAFDPPGRIADQIAPTADTFRLPTRVRETNSTVPSPALNIIIQGDNIMSVTGFFFKNIAFDLLKISFLTPYTAAVYKLPVVTHVDKSLVNIIIFYFYFYFFESALKT